MESSSSPPTTSPIFDRRTSAIQELIKGKELTAHLRIQLQESPDDRSRLETVQTLAEKVEQSIAAVLFTLNSGDADENRRNLSTTQLCSSCSDDGNSKNNTEIKQIPVVKDRRGCYKRRRTADTWTRVSATPFDDGHSWRKYGQKDILGCKYPRSYFRCTHKHDQNCQATKQVQQMEEQSSMHQITYMGHHTCKDLLKAPQFILDTTVTAKDTVILSFESNSTRHQSPSFFSSFNSIKKEIKEENMPSDVTTQISSPSSGYPMPSDLTTFESCEPLLEISDAGEVMSGMCANSHTLDMDMWLDPAKMVDWLGFCDDEEIFKSSV